MGTEIRIFAMKRSGARGIMQWIVRQLESIATVATQVDILGIDAESRIKPVHFDRRPDYYVYTIEDWYLDRAKHKLNRSYCRNYFDIGKGEIIDVVVLRDPYNLFASRMRMWYLNRVEKSKFWVDNHAMKLYLQHLRQFQGTHDVLFYPYTVNFNAWFNNRNYRRNICGQLDIPFTDAGKEEMGEPSAFENCDRPEDMEIFHRCQIYLDNPLFCDLFPWEVQERAHCVFGFNPIPDHSRRLRGTYKRRR